MKRWEQNVFIKDIRRAIDEHSLIESKDRILVGVSGGKDSSILFYALNELSKNKIYDFEVEGITVDHGLIGNISNYKDFCIKNNLPLVVHKEHYAINLSHESAYAPCYTCSRLRKGIIKRYAMENGFNKIAFGHTKDDVVETFFMNIIQHGKLATMLAKSTDNTSDIALIRPLVYLDEKSILKAVEILEIPLMHDNCRFSQNRLRSNAENLIREIELTVPEFSDKVIQALKNIDFDRLL